MLRTKKRTIIEKKERKKEEITKEKERRMQGRRILRRSQIMRE